MDSIAMPDDSYLGVKSANRSAMIGSITLGPVFFTLAMLCHVGLIKDGKIGAGKVRAEKIARVLSYFGSFK